MNQTPLIQQLRALWQPVWQQRSGREKQLLRLGAAVLLFGALWRLALAPAWLVWQQAPAQQARLDAQTQTLLQLQAQARSLQTPSPISRSESAQWLESHLSELGAGAKISLQGERATLSLEAAPAEALARWMAVARQRALAVPLQAQLQSATPAASASASAPAGSPGSSTGSANSASADKASKPASAHPDGSAPLRGTVVLRLP